MGSVRVSVIRSFSFTTAAATRPFHSYLLIKISWKNQSCSLLESEALFLITEKLVSPNSHFMNISVYENFSYLFYVFFFAILWSFCAFEIHSLIYLPCNSLFFVVIRPVFTCEIFFSTLSEKFGLSIIIFFGFSIQININWNFVVVVFVL